MAGINCGILSDASPLTREQIIALENEVLTTGEVCAYLDENSQLCFTGNIDPTIIKGLAWHNAYKITKEDTAITKACYTKVDQQEPEVYDPSTLFKKDTISSDWGQITVVDSSTKKLPSMAFIGQTNLKMIILPDSVTEIGSSAFCDCTNLTEIVIGAGIVKIGSNAFTGCHMLNKVYFKGTETVWNTFVNIESPSGGYLDTATKYFYSDTLPTVEGKFWHFVNNIPVDWAEYVPPRYSDGLFYRDNQDGTSSLFSYGECTDTEVIIAPVAEYGAVTIIKGQAFYNNSLITSITIPASVTTIEGLAFCMCRALTTIIFNGTVAQWNAITKKSGWYYDIPVTYIQCTDGRVEL